MRLIYEADNTDLTRELLGKFNVLYVVVGTLEREKYQNLNEEKFSILGYEAFRSGETVIYQVDVLP